MNKLSKDINKIVLNYLDYSNENLNKILKIYQKEGTFTLKQNLSIEDIIFTCAKSGYKGFYIERYNTCQDDIIDQINNLLIPYKYHETYDGIYSYHNINNIIISVETYQCESNYSIGPEIVIKGEMIDFKMLNLIDMN